MHLLLSGEGKTDIGFCIPSNHECSGENYHPGPMAWFIDQLINDQLDYDFSCIEFDLVSYISKKGLVERKQPSQKKSSSLPGKKRQKETLFFFENARALATVAKEKAVEVNDVVIAVLFRDADGEASAGRGEWRAKHDSIIKGFAAEDFDFGIPMMPLPKSEAWLLCAVKDNPYQHCELLENESGNDNSPNNLKSQLKAALDGQDSTQQLNEMILDGRIDVHGIEKMPSLDCFKKLLKECLVKILGENFR